MADRGLPTGEYHGYITITGSNVTASNGGPATRIPYWYGVPGKSAKYISLLTPTIRQAVRRATKSVSWCAW